jgi:hypothetical protein
VEITPMRKTRHKKHAHALERSCVWCGTAAEREQFQGCCESLFSRFVDHAACTPPDAVQKLKVRAGRHGFGRRCGRPRSGNRASPQNLSSFVLAGGVVAGGSRIRVLRGGVSNSADLLPCEGGGMARIEACQGDGAKGLSVLGREACWIVRERRTVRRDCAHPHGFGGLPLPQTARRGVKATSPSPRIKRDGWAGPRECSEAATEGRCGHHLQSAASCEPDSTRGGCRTAPAQAVTPSLFCRNSFLDGNNPGSLDRTSARN